MQQKQFAALVFIEGLRATGHRLWVEDSTFYIVDAHGQPVSRDLRAWVEPLAQEFLMVLNAETDLHILRAQQLVTAQGS